MDIEIPTELIDAVLFAAAENEVTVEEFVASAIKKYMKGCDTNG